MDYEIIATLGPSSAGPDTWQALLEAGATGFRLNTSHLTLEQLGGWLERLEAFFSAAGRQAPLVLDLQGSKWRLGRFTPFTLIAGQAVTLVRAAASHQVGILPVPHADFFTAAPRSTGEIVLSDARVRLRLEQAGDETVQARVLLGGEIAPGKGITLTGSAHRLEALGEKDQAIVAATRQAPAIRFALSYVRDAGEMQRYRELLGPAAYLIAKIERQPAADEAAQMAAWAGELWLCRGDLGAELGLKGMAQAQHRFSALVRALPVPALLAGQVLEHLTAHPTPTRAEVSGLYEALCQGYRGVVLSDETAIGRYPVESCRVAALFKE